MTNALSLFLREQMDRRGMNNQQLADASGLSKQVVSKWVGSERSTLSRLPHRETLAGFARALNVPIDWLQGKAIESLGLGYATGDYVNTLDNASNDDLLEAIRGRMAQPRRLRAVGPHEVDEAAYDEKDDE